jgi:hypothetical protein
MSASSSLGLKALGMTSTKVSAHHLVYVLRSIQLTPRTLDSAYVYIGNLPHGLTEGDVITVMSQ